MTNSLHTGIGNLSEIIIFFPTDGMTTYKNVDTFEKHVRTNTYTAHLKLGIPNFGLKDLLNFNNLKSH